MYLIYQPEGSEEPQRFKYQPNKLLSPEREMLERRTGKDFSDFTQSVLNGNSVCRRALLFLFLKRAHPGVRWEDVDFTWDELKLEFSRQEYQAMRDAITQNDAGPDQAARLEQLDREMATAIDEADDEGKARLPIAG
ncbi:hypothetical protein [Streptomyces sp.]|uniref:hypothetical protein n=1 Tax=Streptomyces sp. TaxID=1931 RepID=UPI002F3F3C8E